MSISIPWREFPGRGVAALMLFLQPFSDALAYNPFGRGDLDSTALINARTRPGPLTTAEVAVILLADPPVAALTAKTITLGFDADRFFFRPEHSGLLCEFAVGASCPPPSAQYGSMLVSDLPVVPALQFGSPLPNANLQVVYDNTIGFVSVSFATDPNQPLVFETAGDRNWFAFHFEARVPYDPYQTIVTFHDRPGNYDFTQLNASCVSSEPSCGSDMPGFGVSLAPVPEPAALFMGLAGLAGIAAWASRSRVSRRRNEFVQN